MLLAACGSVPTSSPERQPEARGEASEKGHEVMFFALGLIDTGYRFGGEEFGSRARLQRHGVLHLRQGARTQGGGKRR